MGSRWTWALAWAMGVVAGCSGGGSDDGGGTAEFSYDGRCGAYAHLQLWRPHTVTPIVTGAEGLHCELIEGQLPSGMHLDPNTCAISGTPLAIESRFFWVRATASNVSGYADRSCTLDVYGPHLTYGEGVGLYEHHMPGDVISETPRTAGDPGYPWAPGAGESLLYEVSPGTTVPPGLALDPSTGTISGTLGWTESWPEDDWWPFTVRVTATGPLGTVQDSMGVGVFVRLPTISYGYSSHVGSIGTPMTISPPTGYSPAADGASSWEYAVDAWHWSVAGELPAGLAIDPLTGAISGTPTEAANVWPGVTLTVTRNGVSFPLHTSFQIYIPAPL